MKLRPAVRRLGLPLSRNSQRSTHDLYGDSANELIKYLGHHALRPPGIPSLHSYLEIHL